MKFTKGTKLVEVMKPEYKEILMKYRLPCVSCPMAAAEAGSLTLGQIGEAYGIDVDGLLKELNEMAGK